MHVYKYGLGELGSPYLGISFMCYRLSKVLDVFLGSLEVEGTRWGELFTKYGYLVIACCIDFRLVKL